MTVVLGCGHYIAIGFTGGSEELCGNRFRREVFGDPRFNAANQNLIFHYI